MTSQPALSFALLTADVLRALLRGQLDDASQVAGVSLSHHFLEDTWLWQLRLSQIEENPASEPWLARATVRVADGVVIGRAGFHAPPDDRGVVEIGYEVSPEFRRQGYGRATAAALIEEAMSYPEVMAVRASVSPDNAPSLAIVRSLGFVQVGEQIDEIDGLELVFERALKTAD